MLSRATLGISLLSRTLFSLVSSHELSTQGAYMLSRATLGMQRQIVIVGIWLLVREHILLEENTFYWKRTHATDAASDCQCLYLASGKRTHSVGREHMLREENTFYRKRTYYILLSRRMVACCLLVHTLLHCFFCFFSAFFCFLLRMRAVPD